MLAAPVSYVINEVSAEELVQFAEGKIFHSMHCDFEIVITKYDSDRHMTIPISKSCAFQPIGFNFLAAPSDLICRLARIDDNGKLLQGDFIVSVIAAVRMVLIQATLAEEDSTNVDVNFYQEVLKDDGQGDQEEDNSLILQFGFRHEVSRPSERCRGP
jgi:hypothetical protein